MPLVVVPVLRFLGVPDWRALTTLVTTGLIVALMAYVVMFRYTKLLKRWLFA